MAVCLPDVVGSGCGCCLTSKAVFRLHVCFPVVLLLPLFLPRLLHRWSVGAAPTMVALGWRADFALAVAAAEGVVVVLVAAKVVWPFGPTLVVVAGLQLLLLLGVLVAMEKGRTPSPGVTAEPVLG